MPKQPPPERLYNENDLREVMRRVQKISAQNESPKQLAEPTGLSRAEVLETAKELGYSENHTTLALMQYEEELRLARAERELKALGYRGLSGHFIAFFCVNGMLLLAGAWTLAPLWLTIPMVLWATLVLFHLRGAVFPNPDALRIRAKKRILDQQLKQSTREFAQSVSTGAAKLLSLSAEKIDKGIEKISRKD